MNARASAALGPLMTLGTAGARLSLLAVVATLAGCQAPPAPTEKPSLVLSAEGADQLGYRIDWLAAIGLPQGEGMQWAHIAEDLVLVCEQQSNLVTALSLRDGAVQWRQVVGEPGEPVYRPFAFQDKILVSTPTNLFALERETGEVLYLHDLPSVVQAGPVQVDDTAVFGTMTGRVLAMQVESGFTRWAFQMQGSIQASPLALDDGSIFVCDINGVYRMFDRQGKFQWKGRTFDQVTAPAAFGHNTVYLPCEDHSLYAIHARSGRDRWIFRTQEPLEQTPVVVDDAVFQNIPIHGLVAIEAEDGREKWRLDTQATPLQRREDKLLIATDQSLQLIGYENGEPIRNVPTRNLAFSIRLDDGRLLLVSRRGYVQMVSPRD